MPQHPSSQPSPWLLRCALVAAVLAISCAAIFFRKASPTHPITSAAVRLTIASILLAPWVVRATLQKTISKRVALHAVGAGFMYALHFGAWVSSLVLTSVAASVTLVTATPLVLAVVSLFTPSERVPKRIWVALALSFLGLTLIGTTDAQHQSALLGDGLAFLGAVAMAGYLWIGRRVHQNLDVWAFSGIATAVGALGLWTCALLFNAPLTPADGTLVWLLLAALIPQLIGHTTLTWALRHMSPTEVGMATLGEPIFSTALAWWIFAEPVGGFVGVGCICTLAAVWIALQNQAPTPPDSLQSS